MQQDGLKRVGNWCTSCPSGTFVAEPLTLYLCLNPPEPVVQSMLEFIVNQETDVNLNLWGQEELELQQSSLSP